MTRNSPSGDEVERLIRQAVFCLGRPDGDARLLASCVQDLKAVPWERKLAGEPRTWERFCRELLGCEAADLQETVAGAAALQKAGLLNPTVAQAREALRFEVDCAPQPPPPPEPDEPTLEATLTRLERFRLEWLRLTPQEREEFLAWALAQQDKGEKGPAGKDRRKYKR
jgi:hypothetical protein